MRCLRIGRVRGPFKLRTLCSRYKIHPFLVQAPPCPVVVAPLADGLPCHARSLSGLGDADAHEQLLEGSLLLCVAFRENGELHDSLRFFNGRTRLTTLPPLSSKGTWHCAEIDSAWPNTTAITYCCRQSSLLLSRSSQA